MSSACESRRGGFLLLTTQVVSSTHDEQVLRLSDLTTSDSLKPVGSERSAGAGGEAADGMGGDRAGGARGGLVTSSPTGRGLKPRDLLADEREFLARSSQSFQRGSAWKQ